MKNRKSFTVCFTTGHTSSDKGKTAGILEGNLAPFCTDTTFCNLFIVRSLFFNVNYY